MIRLRRIYNFLCSILDYIAVPHVFTIFLYHFGMIYGTNLLTRCIVPVPVFCCLFVSEKLFWEVSRIALIFYKNYFQYEAKTEPEGRPEGSPRGSRRHLASPPSPGRAGVPPGAPVAPLRLSFGLCLRFILEIIPVNYESNPRNFPEQLFWNKKNSRKQELALGILLIG